MKALKQKKRLCKSDLIMHKIKGDHDFVFDLQNEGEGLPLIFRQVCQTCGLLDDRFPTPFISTDWPGSFITASGSPFDHGFTVDLNETEKPTVYLTSKNMLSKYKDLLYVKRK